MHARGKHIRRASGAATWVTCHVVDSRQCVRCGCELELGRRRDSQARFRAPRGARENAGRRAGRLLLVLMSTAVTLPDRWRAARERGDVLVDLAREARRRDLGVRRRERVAQIAHVALVHALQQRLELGVARGLRGAVVDDEQNLELRRSRVPARRATIIRICYTGGAGADMGGESSALSELGARRSAHPYTTNSSIGQRAPRYISRLAAGRSARARRRSSTTSSAACAMRWKRSGSLALSPPYLTRWCGGGGGARAKRAGKRGRGARVTREGSHAARRARVRARSDEERLVVAANEHDRGDASRRHLLELAPRAGRSC